MLRRVAPIILAVVIVIAFGRWYGEQRYKDCVYESIARIQADNTGASASSSFEQVGSIDCSRSPF
ncbi:MAG: hypothetical protein ACR2GZ_12870 [Solirubrobacteraceae bacterium]